ncbi:MAG: cytochrome-c oxidase, cbb3-type subunit III [Proteobacteria bacterium]|nr:cytochrome-c oxidase, cbb3-type subunit III [Pseudomonadota bacterium]
MAKETKKTAPKANKVETTGHVWDGIEEYNNPLPRWWVWVFLACIVFAIGYCVYYPSWPTANGFLRGTAGWSQYKQLADRQAEADAAKAPFEAKIAQMTPAQIAADPELRPYAVASGKAAFAINCSQCHGAGSAGAKGYPNLLDDEWLYGGTLDDIYTTITHGIRSKDDDETRDMGPMPAFGRDEMLTKEEIFNVIAYVRSLSNKALPGSSAIDEGKTIFADNCASCHNDGGIGNRELGAPPLNNAIWLYGGDGKTLAETLHGGRGGVMPAFSKRLDAGTIKKLAVYVHSLGGGEE